MVKNTIIALVAAASFAGAAIPAFADTSDAFGEGSTEMREFMADSIVTQLNQQGINVSDVEEWSGLIRAYVTLEDGSQVMQFYRPGSLTQVAL